MPEKGKSKQMEEKGKKKEISSVIEAMREGKRERGFSYEEIAKRSGLPLGTVQKVLGGITRNPRHSTLAALAGVLLPPKGPEADPGREQPGTVYTVPEPETLFLKEGRPAYITGTHPEKRRGEYTIADRNAIPEEYPSELIDGVIYNMSSPRIRHQSITGSIYRQLWDFIDTRGGSCVPFIAPTDVRLNRDDYTVVDPDVFVVCKKDTERTESEQYIDGAPDFVVEVLSPSTRKKDMGIKLDKYRNAGVREYWIVDPEKEKVIVHIFGEEPDVCLYGFDSEVPVGIYEGECRIDFRRVVRDLEMARRIYTGPAF